VPQRHTPFEQTALLLQGGGALGAYQAGVYEALAEADLHLCEHGYEQQTTSDTGRERTS
jgi:predicted patatin/cPLA2 family phospholipase